LLTGRYQQRFGHELQPGDRYPSCRLEYLVANNFILTGDWKLNGLTTYPSKASMDSQGLPQSEITKPLKPNSFLSTSVSRCWFSQA